MIFFVFFNCDIDMSKTKNIYILKYYIFDTSKMVKKGERLGFHLIYLIGISYVLLDWMFGLKLKQ